MRWTPFLVGLLAAPALWPAKPALAQRQEHTRTARITVRVHQIAGTDIYLDVGTQKGIAAGDTLAVLGRTSPAIRGALAVVAATETRSVLTFAGPPFPVTRGESLVLRLPRKPAAATPPTTVPVPRSTATQATRPALRSAPAPVGSTRVADETPPRTSEPSHPATHGSLSLGLSGMRSTTQIGSPIPAHVARAFATPTMGLDLTAPRAVGPLTLHTSMYLSYRYSSGDIVRPAMATNVYAANLEGDFRHFRFMLGRFHSPMESYSGFWDGLMLRAGGTGFGVGAMAGFEPNLWDERPSLSTPKAALFVDGRAHGQGWWWSGNLTATSVRPSHEPGHTFFEASQRWSAGPVWLSHDLEVDRNPTNGKWTVSQLYVRASVALTSHVQVHGGFARSQPWLLQLPGFHGPLFGARSDQVDAGLSLQGGGAFVSADLFTGSDAPGGRTRGATGTLTVLRLPGLRHVGASASISRWSGPYGTTLFAAPSLIVDLSGTTLRVGYRLNRARYLGRPIVTNGVDVGLDAPLAGGFRLSGTLQAQFGGVMTTQFLDLGLYRTF